MEVQGGGFCDFAHSFHCRGPPNTAAARTFWPDVARVGVRLAGSSGVPSLGAGLVEG